MKTEEFFEETENSLLKFVINIGENAKENDILFANAKQNDIWFHLKNKPSAHVWLSSDDISTSSIIKRKYIVKCCQYVIQHSKCSTKNNVINYIEKRHLKKDYSKTGSVFLKKKPNTMKC